jgi:hypothetical protein
MTRALWLEVALVTLVAAAGAAAIPLSSGYFTWSWDALNHHVYLGMTAEHPRWALDVNPASVQTYQYPYLYWPAYRLSLLTGSGASLGALWTSFQAVMIIVPLWWISLRLLPDTGHPALGVVERVAACALAGMSVVVLTGIETTASDLLAAVPLLWAVGVGLGTPATNRRAFVCAALWGMSTAFKLSNGMFLPLLLFWWWRPERPYFGAWRGGSLAAGACLGFGLFYAPWGLPLWRLTGNPFHPFLGHWFGGG